jgi:multimeric flavodoxin WrbA
MKITAIIGSPRPQGYGATIERALLDLLGEDGRRAAIYELNKLAYRGCQACLTCKTTSDACVAEDDLTPILKEIRLSDLVIISAPIFMGEISGQAKALLDRFYSYLGPDFRTNPKSGRLAGKTLVFILTQGNPDEQTYAAVLARHLRTFDMCGFSTVYPVQVCGARPGNEARAKEKTMARLAEVARLVGLACADPLG